MKKLLDKSLSRLQRGAITLVDGESRLRHGPADADLHATVTVHDARFYREVALGGTIGAGEAYMQRWWSTDDLTVLMRILVRNLDAVDGMEDGIARLAAPVRKVMHWLNRNTRGGSRRNIAAHYDLGNEFFALMLDHSMMYSCAVFEDASMSLAEAQAARLDLVCAKLDLGPDDHLLEIGTGWGGMAIHAAKHTGCRVTTTTISRQQHDLAVQRVAAAGLSNRISVLLEDYRDLSGRYDKLVSLEMIEAVGHDFYDDYFERCAGLLRPGGLMLLQAITIADQRYEAARCSVDFIQRYIFPGSCIPSITAMAQSITRASDLRVIDLEDIGPHYATTLAHWRRNFMRNIDAVRGLGYPERFIRMWEFYLCYCEGGFAERALGDVHVLLAKPPLPAHALRHPVSRMRKAAINPTTEMRASRVAARR